MSSVLHHTISGYLSVQQDFLYFARISLFATFVMIYSVLFNLLNIQIYKYFDRINRCCIFCSQLPMLYLECFCILINKPSLSSVDTLYFRPLHYGFQTISDCNPLCPCVLSEHHACTISNICLYCRVWFDVLSFNLFKIETAPAWAPRASCHWKSTSAFTAFMADILKVGSCTRSVLLYTIQICVGF